MTMTMKDIMNEILSLCGHEYILCHRFISQSGSCDSDLKDVYKIFYKDHKQIIKDDSPCALIDIDNIAHVMDSVDQVASTYVSTKPDKCTLVCFKEIFYNRTFMAVTETAEEVKKLIEEAEERRLNKISAILSCMRDSRTEKERETLL